MAAKQHCNKINQSDTIKYPNFPGFWKTTCSDARPKMSHFTQVKMLNELELLARMDFRQALKNKVCHQPQQQYHNTKDRPSIDCFHDPIIHLVYPPKFFETYKRPKRGYNNSYVNILGVQTRCIMGTVKRASIKKRWYVLTFFF